MSETKKILIIDDDNDFNSLLTEIFEQADYEVVSQTSPTKGLELLGEESFDLLVLDQKMPDLRGVELLEKFRQINATLPVVVVSGFLENASTQDFINLGVSGIFFKPLNIFALIKRVEEIFQGKIKSSGSMSALTDLGIRGFTRSPFDDATSKEEFLKKVKGLADFQGNLLLIGNDGSPFEKVAKELTKVSQGQKLLKWEERYATSPELIEGGVPLTFLVYQPHRLSGAQRDCFYKIAKKESPFRTLGSVRFIFCFTQPVDELYESGTINDQFYLFLGNLELELPKPVDPQMLHRAAGIERAASHMGSTQLSGRVLVLDDEDLHAQMVCDLLKEDGLDGLKITNPSEALLALRKERFSLVVTDFRMPGISGLDFVSQAHQIDPSLPVLVVTGNIQLPEMVRVGNMGVARLIPKPIDPRGFIQEVRNLIRP